MLLADNLVIVSLVALLVVVSRKWPTAIDGVPTAIRFVDWWVTSVAVEAYADNLTVVNKTTLSLLLLSIK